MREVVVVSSVRTPVGRAYKGTLRATRHDALGRHGNRLQAGRAEPIDRHCRHLNRQPRAQRRDAGHVHPLLSLRHGAAQDDVFNFFGLKLRHAGERALDRNGSQFIRTRRPQRTLIRAAHRSADGRNQDDFSHRVILIAERAECAKKIIGSKLTNTNYPLPFFNCCFQPNTRALLPSASASGTIPFF